MLKTAVFIASHSLVLELRSPKSCALSAGLSIQYGGEEISLSVRRKDKSNFIVELNIERP